MYRTISASALLAVLLACSDSLSPGNGAETIELTPKGVELWVPDSAQLTAKNRSGGELAGPVQWSSSNLGVATVDVTGKIIASRPGVTTITASVGGLSAEVTVRVRAAELVFEGYPGDGIAEAFRVPIDGGGPQRLFAPGVVAMDPVFSPDGSRVLYVVADYPSGVGDVYVANADGSDSKRLTWDEELDDTPAWSPDGARVAYRTFASGNAGEVWVRDLVKGGEANLTPKYGTAIVDHQRPSWSPNGERIAFATTAGGDWGIWTMKADGTDWKQLSNTPELDVEPAWSPDGERIAFRRVTAAGSDLVVMNADGSDVKVLAMSGQERQPAWSPDGRRIAFVGQPGIWDTPEIFSMRPDGSDVKQHTFAAWGRALNPSWRVVH